MDLLIVAVLAVCGVAAVIFILFVGGSRGDNVVSVSVVKQDRVAANTAWRFQELVLSVVLSSAKELPFDCVVAVQDATKPDKIEMIQCDSSWLRAGKGSKSPPKSPSSSSEAVQSKYLTVTVPLRALRALGFTQVDRVHVYFVTGLLGENEDNIDGKLSLLKSCPFVEVNVYPSISPGASTIFCGVNTVEAVTKELSDLRDRTGLADIAAQSQLQRLLEMQTEDTAAIVDDKLRFTVNLSQKVLSDSYILLLPCGDFSETSPSHDLLQQLDQEASRLRGRAATEEESLDRLEQLRKRNDHSVPILEPGMASAPHFEFDLGFLLEDSKLSRQRKLLDAQFRVCVVLCAPSGERQSSAHATGAHYRVPVAAYFSTQVCKVFVPEPVFLPISAEGKNTPSKALVSHAPVGTQLQCIFVRSIFERIDSRHVCWALCRDLPDGHFEKGPSLNPDFEASYFNDRFVRRLTVPREDTITESGHFRVRVLHRHRDASVLAGPVFSLDPLPVPTVDRASSLSSEADCVTFHVGEDIVTTHPTLNTSSDYATLPQAFAIVQFKGALRQDSSFAEDLADQLAAAYSIESFQKIKDSLVNARDNDSLTKSPEGDLIAKSHSTEARISLVNALRLPSQIQEPSHTFSLKTERLGPGWYVCTPYLPQVQRGERVDSDSGRIEALSVANANRVFHLLKSPNLRQHTILIAPPRLQAEIVPGVPGMVIHGCPPAVADHLVLQHFLIDDFNYDQLQEHGSAQGEVVADDDARSGASMQIALGSEFPSPSVPGSYLIFQSHHDPSDRLPTQVLATKKISVGFVAHGSIMADALQFAPDSTSGMSSRGCSVGGSSAVDFRGKWQTWVPKDKMSKFLKQCGPDSVQTRFKHLQPGRYRFVYEDPKSLPGGPPNAVAVSNAVHINGPNVHVRKTGGVQIRGAVLHRNNALSVTLDTAMTIGENSKIGMRRIERHEGKALIDFVAPSALSAVGSAFTVPDQLLACVRLSTECGPRDFVALYPTDTIRAGEASNFVPGTQHFFDEHDSDTQWTGGANIVVALSISSNVKLEAGQYRIGLVRAQDPDEKQSSWSLRNVFRSKPTIELVFASQSRQALVVNRDGKLQFLLARQPYPVLRPSFFPHCPLIRDIGSPGYGSVTHAALVATQHENFVKGLHEQMVTSISTAQIQRNDSAALFNVFQVPTDSTASAADGAADSCVQIFDLVEIAGLSSNAPKYRRSTNLGLLICSSNNAGMWTKWAPLPAGCCFRRFGKLRARIAPPREVEFCRAVSGVDGSIIDGGGRSVVTGTIVEIVGRCGPECLVLWRQEAEYIWVSNDDLEVIVEADTSSSEVSGTPPPLDDIIVPPDVPKRNRPVAGQPVDSGSHDDRDESDSGSDSDGDDDEPPPAVPARVSKLPPNPKSAGGSDSESESDSGDDGPAPAVPVRRATSPPGQVHTPPSVKRVANHPMNALAKTITSSILQQHAKHAKRVSGRRGGESSGAASESSSGAESKDGQERLKVHDNDFTHDGSNSPLPPPRKSKSAPTQSGGSTATAGADDTTSSSSSPPPPPPRKNRSATRSGKEGAPAGVDGVTAQAPGEQGGVSGAPRDAAAPSQSDGQEKKKERPRRSGLPFGLDRTTLGKVTLRKTKRHSRGSKKAQHADKQSAEQEDAKLPRPKSVAELIEERRLSLHAEHMDASSSSEEDDW